MRLFSRSTPSRSTPSRSTQGRSTPSQGRSTITRSTLGIAASCVAAAVLAESDRHAGATYELTAPGRYTAHDIAKIISGVAGREVVAERIESEVFLKASLGVDSLAQFPYQARVSGAISKRYSSNDFIGNPNVLTWLLGRKPTTFEQFVQTAFNTFGAS